jgi:radical SAM superfamily enzyme YgiQ (UPF0313 family)
MCLLRMRQAAFKMVAMAQAHGCQVIVAGSDASDHPAAYLSAGADFVLIGEGEETLVELLDRLSGKSTTSFEQIPGLVFQESRPKKRLRAGNLGEPEETIRFRRTEKRQELHNLDRLPFPAWDLVDVERYRQIWLKQHGYFSMNVASTRGCPYHCNWCAKPIWGQRYNVRSPENVVAELIWLKGNYQPDHIWFVDDIFGLKPGWLPRFADIIELQQVQLKFKCLSRVDLLTRPGEVEALRRAGCQIVWVGAES